MVVVCVDVRDPGNAGTMIRTADAAGVDAVVCCDGTVDPTNPKTVRASAGSIFHMPVVVGGERRHVIGVRTLGHDGGGHRGHGGGPTTPGSTGADRWRSSSATRPRGSSVGDRGLDERISVPMVGRAESLNVSVSAAVVCFEALRQRRLGHGARAGFHG